jgi:hypothetical protein
MGRTLSNMPPAKAKKTPEKPKFHAPAFIRQSLTSIARTVQSSFFRQISVSRNRQVVLVRKAAKMPGPVSIAECRRVPMVGRPDAFFKRFAAASLKSNHVFWSRRCDSNSGVIPLPAPGEQT